MKKVLCIVTMGEGGLDELRARRLAAALEAEVTFFFADRSQSYPQTVRRIWQVLASRHWDLVYQEGTGVAGGINLIRAALTRRQRFVVSVGDPIGGFFAVTRGPLLGCAFGLYERLLYRTSAGIVGWTPYLTGASLRLGARRATTVEGAVDLDIFAPVMPAEKRALKQRFGLNPDHLVIGMVGSLNWSRRQAYCYGLELIEALKRLHRSDASVLIVGDGSGRSRLEKAIPESLRPYVVFTGRLPQSDVVAAMNAMDIGFVTQTLDALGNYRLTTKLPEYLACGLPVAMSPVPGFYDYVTPAGWALPPFHPASTEFHAACAAWLDALCWEEVHERASRARQAAVRSFDYGNIERKFREFTRSLMA